MAKTSGDKDPDKKPIHKRKIGGSKTLKKKKPTRFAVTEVKNAQNDLIAERLNSDESRGVTTTANQSDYDINDIINIIGKNKSSSIINSPKLDEITTPQIEIKTTPIKKLKTQKVNDTGTQSYIDSKKFLADNKINISTITIDCTLRVDVYIEKMAKFVILKEDGILSVKCGGRKKPVIHRTIVETKKKAKNFDNQITILMRPIGGAEDKFINIKIFNNGSIHTTGCTDMDDFNDIMKRLTKILSKGQDIRTKRHEIKHIKYIRGKKDVKIRGIKIRMINSNFYLGYKIDRKKLAFLLKKYHGIRTTDTEIGYVEFTHKPNGGHACVNIKFTYDENNRISIFVFQTGAIIITGAKNLNYIIASYHYVYLILNKFMNQIKIVELNPDLVNAEINLYSKNRKKSSKDDNIMIGLDLSDIDNYNKIHKRRIIKKSSKIIKSNPKPKIKLKQVKMKI